jgi:hypothetical protein
VLELGALVVIVTGVWLWLDSTRVRELAVAAARAACDAENVQFLDDTVAFRALTLARDGEGRVRVRRAYAFEYSDTGNNRLHGSVVMLGSQVLLINVGVPHLRVVH